MFGQSKAKGWGEFLGLSTPQPATTPVKMGNDTDEPYVGPRDEVETSNMETHKELYYKLQNLEKYPEVLHRSRNLLIAMLAECLAYARSERPEEDILQLDTYSREGLNAFIKSKDDQVLERWEQYVQRRKDGGPMELFKDRDEAVWWLKQIAPVKFVDGAWLGYINKITLPFALRPIIKYAWQILSEELGDGELDKNHAHLYRELTREIAPELPDGDDPDFIDSRHDMNEPSVWKSALAQLLISLFPHEFFPEILGFNMHFEAVALETLKACKELKEVKLDPYYFMLHVSIDNADSGHTAIAQRAVAEYVEHVQATQGAAAAHQAWRRVQAGYTLSESLPSSTIAPSQRKPAVDSFPRNPLEGEVIDIFRAKALVGQKMHCHSTVKIGRRKLVDYLDPESLNSKQFQMEFLDDFAGTKGWIKRGDSNNSRFIRELSWGGRMFGAFTQAECDVTKAWIDALPNPHPQLYWEFTGREDDMTSENWSKIDLRFNRSAWLPLSALEPAGQEVVAVDALPTAKVGLDLSGDKRPDVAKFFSIWFTHPCLLESLIAIPYKTTTPFACAIVKVLRAQAGFDIEGAEVAGMDEANRTDTLGLIELGQEMLQNWRLPEIGTLKQVLEVWECDFAITMLRLAMQPMANKGLLIGMAMAFASFHEELAQSSMLSENSREVLLEISRREKENLTACFKDLEDTMHEDSCRGFSLASAQIRSCFE